MCLVSIIYMSPRMKCANSNPSRLYSFGRAEPVATKKLSPDSDHARCRICVHPTNQPQHIRRRGRAWPATAPVRWWVDAYLMSLLRLNASERLHTLVHTGKVIELDGVIVGTGEHARARRVLHTTQRHSTPQHAVYELPCFGESLERELLQSAYQRKGCHRFFVAGHLCLVCDGQLILLSVGQQLLQRRLLLLFIGC